MRIRLAAMSIEPGRRPDDLLATGKAAGLLGCSRQHVVDMCLRGELPYVWVGRHRRIRRSDVEAIIGNSGDRPAGVLTRDQERSLWLHRALLGTLLAEPEAVLAAAHANLDRLLAQQTGTTMAVRWALEWRRVLDQGLDRVADVLTSCEPLALELRQNSPFAGTLPQETRAKVLASFRAHWRDEHSARKASAGPRVVVAAAGGGPAARS
jgi:excisionase family DNA binding protein